MTYTYVLLAVSLSTYREVKAKFLDAGYDHAFHREDDREVIDMRGVAIAADGTVAGPSHRDELRSALRDVPPGGASGDAPAWIVRLHRAACAAADVAVVDDHPVCLPARTPPAPPPVTPLDERVTISLEEPMPDVIGGRWFWHLVVTLRRPGRRPLQLETGIKDWSRDKVVEMSRELAADLKVAGLLAPGGETPPG